MYIYFTIFNWQIMKMKMKKISSENLQLSASGNATGISAFKIIKNVYPLPLKANYQIFSILTTCQVFFFLPGSTSFEDSLMGKVIVGTLESISLKIWLIADHDQQMK